MLCFTLCSTSFAVDSAGVKIVTPLLTNIRTGDFVLDDGTAISWATFYENGVYSSIEHTVTPNGVYTTKIVEGDTTTYKTGAYTNYSVPTPSLAHLNTTPARSVTYTYWGTSYYQASADELERASTVTGMASTLVGIVGGVIGFYLGLASILIYLMSHYQSTYGSDWVYFTASKYYGIENTGSRPIYHHLIYTKIYSDAARSHWIDTATDNYNSTNFYF